MLDLQQQLIEDIASFKTKPLSFVKYAFEWGEGELKGKYIEKWQEELLLEIETGLLTINEAIQIAIASGHGIGKSACVSWIILWGLSTFEDTKIVITANTETQLKTKTWAELAKWHRLCITKDWFEFTATALYSKDKGHEKTWRCDMIAWSERNTEAFAGMHNEGKRVILLFDEASAIPDIIWEVAEGAMTDKNTEILFLVFGNPTRNSGRFRECFFRYKHRWKHKQIDSRTVSFTNKLDLDKKIEDYGIDSDYVKVRILGQFPSMGDLQFISSEYVDRARGKHIDLMQYNFAPSIIGVDPAWSGGDKIAIVWRQGNASKVLKVIPRNDDDYKIAQIVIPLEEEYQADAVFIDFGYGTGIYSALKSLGHKSILVPFGGESSDPQYLNKRAEMWGLMKQWLKDGGVIPNDNDLCNELISPEYYIIPTGHNAGKLAIESKEDMKKRGIQSPNIADGLALTFAMPVRKKERNPILKRINNDTKKDTGRSQRVSSYRL